MDPVAAAALPESEPPPLSPGEALDSWDQATRRLTLLLHANAPDAAWLEALHEQAREVRALARRDADFALYALLQRAGADVSRYSAHHALLCAVACELCAPFLDTPAEHVESLVHAALTMNLAMSAMQDSLARQHAPLSAEQRHAVDGHAEQGAALLAGAGVSDARWLAIVRQHHAGAADEPLAALLRRVDMFTAKLSRRARREPASPALAARHGAGMDAAGAGAPDRVGAALLRGLGLYPPGCFVQLVCGDLCVVVRRGSKAHTPLVAALRRADGALHLQPLRRDTADRRHAVAHGVAAAAVRVNLNHARTLGIAWTPPRRSVAPATEPVAAG